MERDWEWALTHAGNLNRIDPDVTEEIWSEMQAYIWIDMIDRRERMVTCERCESRWIEGKKRTWESDLPRGQRCVCPKCGETVIAKHISFRGVGYKIREKLNVVWWKKSELDPNIVVAIGARCERDYEYADNLCPWTLDTNIDICAVQVFVYGQGAIKFTKKPIWSILQMPGEGPIGYEWVRVKRLGDISFGDNGGPRMFGAQLTKRVMLVDTFESAIANTPFERAWCNEYDLMHRNKDGTVAMALIAKYPCIEYLTKLGMQDFLFCRIMEELPTGLINWRGKTMDKVLRISKQRIGELKAAKIRLTPGTLLVLQYVDKHGLRCTVEAANNIGFMYNSLSVLVSGFEKAVSYHQPNRRSKAIKYMGKFSPAENLGVSDFADYWDECVKLEANLNDDAVAFPKHFHEAHERNRIRLKQKADAEVDKRITDRLDELTRRFAFEFGGLILRPAASSAEVIREGEVLSHCVGSYVGRYADGKTVICVLRRAVEPDTPWRTVELTTDGKLVQDRGYKNDMHQGLGMTDAYRAMLGVFWGAWNERKIPKKERKAA